MATIRSFLGHKIFFGYLHQAIDTLTPALIGVPPANPKFRTLSIQNQTRSNFGTENNVDELNLKRQQCT
jgi:hypothetical protein